MIRDRTGLSGGRSLPLSCLLLLPCLASAQIEAGIIGGMIGGLMPLMPRGSGATSSQQFAVDSLRLDVRVLDSMAARLGAEPTSRSMNEYCYERRVLLSRTYDFCFIAEWPEAKADTVVVDTNDWGADTVRLRKDRMFGYYFFRASTGDRYAVSANLAAFLNSAYHQELFPAYRHTDSLFLPLSGQTQRGLWMRGAVSMGWAAGYAGRDNPFMSAKGVVRGLYYALDGGFVLAGAVTAIRMAIDGSPERIPGMLLGAKAGHMALSWLIFTPLISLELGETLKLRSSGYRFPATMRPDPGFF